MLTPPPLKKGDKIGIISTARKISKKEITSSIKTFKLWGLLVVLGKNLFKKHFQFAGNEEERASDLQEMVENKEIKAIVFARGGYGTIKILDRVDFSLLLKRPKWLVGYSDITILHSQMNIQRIGSIHSSMPINFSKNTKGALDSLRKVLYKRKITYHTRGYKLNKKGNATGELVGGNLSILYSLLGSKTEIETKNKILFIEDVDEYIYHIERMVISLKRANKLKDLAGLIVGKMTDIHDNKVRFGETVQQLIFNAVKEYGYPVCFNFPSGHVPNNKALIFGKNVTLNVEKKTTLII